MIVLPDNSRTDGVANAMLQRINTDIPMLLISRVEELNFNEDVLKLKGKKYIVFDVIENGWNEEITDTLLVGKNEYMFPFLKGDGWKKLGYFIHSNPPYLYFKRELLKKDATYRIKSIEYPNWQPEYATQSKEEFNNRPISVMNFWGRSHEARLILHGEIWKNAARKGYAVCDNIYYFNHFMKEENNPNKWVTLNIPHYARLDISEILAINGMSKLSISLPGCGIKCFRSTGESIVNSIAVMPEDNLEYSYPFDHNVNCIKFPVNSVDGVSKEWEVIEQIELALKNDNLYEIYLESLKTAKYYQIDNYINNYLLKEINARL